MSMTDHQLSAEVTALCLLLDTTMSSLPQSVRIKDHPAMYDYAALHVVSSSGDWLASNQAL